MSRSSPRMILDDIVVPSAAADDDDPVFLQFAYDLDDFLLRFIDIAHLDGAHHIDFFLHHFDRALRHIAEELVLQAFVCTFERLRNCFAIDALKDFAYRRVIKLGDVFKDEHQLTDGISDFGLFGFDIFQHFASLLPVHPVEHFCDRTNAAESAAKGNADGFELLLKYLRNAENDLGRNTFQLSHSDRYFRLHLFWKSAQQLSGASQRQVGQNERDGLWMFVLNKLRKL